MKEKGAAFSGEGAAGQWRCKDHVRPSTAAPRGCPITLWLPQQPPPPHPHLPPGACKPDAHGGVTSRGGHGREARRPRKLASPHLPSPATLVTTPRACMVFSVAASLQVTMFSGREVGGAGGRRVDSWRARACAASHARP